MKRLFIFEPFPVQYHAPVYRTLADLARRSGEGTEIRVFYATDATVHGRYDAGFRQVIAWDEPLLEGYAFSLCPDRQHWKLPWLLCTNRPGAVLLTHFHHPLCWLAYLTSLLLGVPVWLRMETRDGAFVRKPTKDRLRSAFYRLYYAAVDHVFAIGESNRAHYLRHGIGPANISYAHYCVVDRFAGIAPEERERLRRRARVELGLTHDRTTLIFAGKLQEKKNPGCILEALTALTAEERRRFAVLFVGSGELEAVLRDQAARLPEVEIRFLGFRNQTELLPCYLASDVLVLPSRQMGETWGLVVNEALLAELRVILSAHVGCLADFRPLPSIEVFDGSSDGLCEALRHLPDAQTVRANRSFLARYSVESAAAAIWSELRDAELAAI